MELHKKDATDLAELHAHIAPSIPPAVYWHIANSEGYKLPKREYREFIEYVRLSPKRKMSLHQYLDEIYHPILDKLSSGSRALEKGVYASLSGAYRSNNITLLELRGNPMKHNHDGEVDLDHAIMAMLRGMERALLEYPKLKAGMIFCLDRQFPIEKNTIIVEKAIKYHRRGVVGIDFSNYVFHGKNPHNFQIKQYVDLVSKARKAGLKVTIHAGETKDAVNDMQDAVDCIKPDRIGHGIMAAYDKPLMKQLKKQNITLEICPLSNLMTKAVKDTEEMKYILRTFWDNGIKFCLNTDWPEMIENNSINDVHQYILDNNIFTPKELKQIIRWGFEATFITLPNPDENLYL